MKSLKHKVTAEQFIRREVNRRKLFISTIVRLKIPFLVIGGVARYYHRVQEFTQDLDLLFRDSDRERVCNIARNCGYNLLYRSELFEQFEQLLDLMFLDDEVSDELFKDSIVKPLDGIPVNVASQQALYVLKHLQDRHSNPKGRNFAEFLMNQPIERERDAGVAIGFMNEMGLKGYSKPKIHTNPFNIVSSLAGGIIGALVTSPLYVVHRYLYDKYLIPVLKEGKGKMRKNPLEDRVIIKEYPTHASHRYPVTVDDIRKSLHKFRPEHLALLVKEGIEIHLAKPGYMVQSGTIGQYVKSRKVINIYSIKTRRGKDGKLKFQHFWPTVMIMFRTQPPSWISEEDAKLIALNSTLPHEIGHAVHFAMRISHEGLRIGPLGEEELFATAFEKNFQATHGIMQTPKTAYELQYLPFQSGGIRGRPWLQVNPDLTNLKKATSMLTKGVSEEVFFTGFLDKSLISILKEINRNPDVATTLSCSGRHKRNKKPFLALVFKNNTVRDYYLHRFNEDGFKIYKPIKARLKSVKELYPGVKEEWWITTKWYSKKQVREFWKSIKRILVKTSKRYTNPFVKPGDSIKAFIPATGEWIKAKVLSEPKEKAECTWIRIMHGNKETTAVWNDIGKFYVVGRVE